jgi:predicted ribosome quality control (RQC) complex YloA/Tae2 family protein
MAFDGMFVYAITEELKQNLSNGKITKIYQPYERELLFNIRAQGKNHKLFISANPSYPRIHLTEESFQNPQEAPMFCMLLRKHLEGGVIEGIKQVDMERIIYIDVRSRDELGDTSMKRLIIEIMGRHSNIILVDPERNMILDSIHHVTHAINQHRVLLPGREYVTPPEQDKKSPFLADQETFIKKINFNQGKLDSQIVQQFSGISPLLAKEIVQQTGLANRESLSESFLTTINKIKHLDIEPTLITGAEKSTFYLFPLQHVEGSQQTFSTVSDLLEKFFHGKAERDRVKQKAHDFARFLSNEKNKNEKKIKKLEKTREDSQKADQYKLFGELLTAYLHQVKRGDTTVQVINYYDENGTSIDIPLDPQLSPNKNAQAYFKKYTKAKKSVAIVDEQIRLAQEEIEYFETLSQQLEQASPRDVEEIREELIEGGYIRDRSKKKKKKKKADKPQLQSYYSSDGTEILVGKNNKQNEHLTNRIGQSSNTWLHTKDIPGSHVLIRSDQYTEETLLEAAQLAAFYSKAGSSSQVPVDYTLIKHVKKPSGAKPGYVIYDHQKTVFVTPSEEKIEEMRKRKP